MNHYTYQRVTWVARTPEQKADDEREQMWSAMLRNDELNKDNINVNLEESLKCARIGNWAGMAHCHSFYAQEESRRLKARAQIMERHGIEIYRSNPYQKREHALYTELFDLCKAFLLTAKETDTRLLAAYQEKPDPGRSYDLINFRHTVGYCYEVFQWLANPMGESEVNHA